MNRSASNALTGSAPPLPSSPTTRAATITATTAARYTYSSVVLLDALVSVLIRRTRLLGRCLLLTVDLHIRLPRMARLGWPPSKAAIRRATGVYPRALTPTPDNAGEK